MTKPKSLKRYIVTLLLTLAFAMSALLSFQSAYYLIEAFDVMGEKLMFKIAINHQVPAGETLSVMDYHLSRDWHTVPETVRQHFEHPPQTLNVSEVRFENWAIISPPESVYAVMKTTDAGGHTIYISQVEHLDLKSPLHFRDDEWHIDPMVSIILRGLGSIVAFLGLVLLMMKIFTRPISSLYDWAKTLKLDQLDQQHPDFRYLELNALADIIHDSMKSAENTLKREQEFLQYASHELRTPIAVLRTNSALLEKINPNPDDREREIRDRINRASLTMKDMTETLLWLSRESTDIVPTEQICLAEMVQQVSNELHYLLQGKDVELAFDLQPFSLELPEQPSRILLANLIRNAFQHTASGQIIIHQQQGVVKIINDLKGYSVNAENKNQDIGFGLGLKLCQKLADRFDWRLKTIKTEDKHIVSIQFL